MERYQDALLADGTEPGERDCASRWSLIDPHVPDQGMILDVGSNLGYFALRAVQTKPHVAVVSIESSKKIAERQRNILAQHQTTRICLVRGAVRSGLTRAWVQTCDWFDLTLLLSVIHWFNDPVAVVRDLSMMSGRLIAEVPDRADSGACGQGRLRLLGDDPVAWFREHTGRRVTHLGRVARHTSEHPSHMIMVDGPVSRRPSIAYWDSIYPHPAGQDYSLDHDGERVQLRVRGRPVDFVPGINLVTLMKLGQLLHPAPSYWIAAARDVMTAWPDGHGDPFPHNMLWTAGGLRLIDADDQRTGVSSERALDTFERAVGAWWRNRTTTREAYARELLGPARYARRAVGRMLRRVFSDRMVEDLKLRLGI